MLPLTTVRIQRNAKSPFVFVSERGAPFTVSGLQKMVERVGIEAKMPFKVHPHMLRHATGYALANKGTDSRTLQAYLDTTGGCGGRSKSQLRNKCFVTKTIDFFLDVQDSRFEVSYHRIVDRRMREGLVDFLREDLPSLFEHRYVGSQHNALRRP